MKTALVLCGGGSLGAYEIGAWKYLQEVGMHFDIVTGTSIGAINGAMVATDDYEKAEALWNNVAADQVMVNGVNFYSGFLHDFDKQKGNRLWSFAKTFIKNGGADITPLVNLVHKSIDPKKIKETKTRIGVVTTTYPGLKEVDVILNDVKESLILDYLHASSACYPIFPMYTINHQKYIDGGYHNNLPIDLAIKMGADKIVAVLLHAVPKVPQHPEYMKLPFVTTIRPSHDTGSIMDFDGKVAKRNMLLGYLDAKKTFGDCWGRSYCFKKDESLSDIMESFALAIANNDLEDFYKTTGALAYEGKTPKSSREIFIRTLESLAEEIDMDYCAEYEVIPFIKSLIEKIRGLGKKKEAMDFRSHHNYSFSISKKEKNGFLLYLDYLATNHMKMNKIDALVKRNPEVAAYKEIYLVFDKLGLL